MLNINKIINFSSKMVEVPDCLKEQLHICPICFRGFRTRIGMLQHVRLSHQDKDFVCDKCGLVSLSQQTLRAHAKKCPKKQQEEN